MMPKLLVVLGATGTQGGSVVNAYLKKSKWIIRAVTRDPSKPASKALEEKGVEIVKADINDYASLEAAFRGANMVFAVTDFWATFKNPASQAKLSSGQALGDYAYNVEVAQGKTIARAVATTLDTLELFIWSSLADVSKWSKGKYTWVYHFDGKAQIWAYIQTAYPALAAKTSVVQLGFYADNWKISPFFAPHQTPSGAWELTYVGSSNRLLPFVDTVRDTGNIVVGMERIGPGKTVLAYSEMMTIEQWLRILSKVSGVEVNYRQINLEDMERIAPGGLGREVGESGLFVEEFGWTGGEEGILDPKDLGVATTSMEYYIQNEDWSPLFHKKL